MATAVNGLGQFTLPVHDKLFKDHVQQKKGKSVGERKKSKEGFRNTIKPQSKLMRVVGSVDVGSH